VTNEFGARVVADHKGRFGLFATLPLPHIDESLKEIEYAFDTLKADGVFVWTNYGDHWLGEKAFAKVFDELNRRKAVVYTHYAQSPCCFGRQPDTQLQPETPGMHKIEMPTNTTRAIWSLIYDGPPGKSTTSAATRYSDVTFIWSHAGGSLVGLAGQFLGVPTAAETLAKVPEKNSKLYHLRRFYYDTAQAANQVQMPALKALVGTSQIVFGSEFPVWSPDVSLKGLQTCGFTPDELRAIDRDNAVRFLPKWK
jgi:6-methylsalicylate decarboxylase